MHQDDNETKTDLESILSKLSSLEDRVINLEGLLGVSPKLSFNDTVISEEENNETYVDETTDSEFRFESRVGGFGLALLGSIVLFFGITFLSQYIQNTGYPLFSGIFGYLSVIGFYFLAGFIKKQVDHLSEMFDVIGKLLLYYVTLRLHYFTDNPLITNEYFSLALLVGVIGYQVYVSFKKNSELHAAIALIFALGTGFLSNNTHVMLLLTILASAGAVYFFFKHAWKRTLIVSILLVYISFLIWILKNSTLTGLSAQLIFTHHYSHLYLFGCASLFSLITLVPRKDVFKENFLIFAVILNGILFTLLLAILTFSYFTENYKELYIIISLFCMIFSILLKSFSKWKFAPAFFAMYGFMAISISIYGILKLPYTYLMLSIQSLYVVSIALWFRSKIIISMNALLFFMLLITYLFSSASVDSINFSFAAVALLSARIINWKRKLLEIKTTLIRNFYLIVTFLMTLYALFKSVPEQYVTLSWTIAAIGFFLLSLILRNIKYRWMAIGSMIVTAFYLFIIDLAKISMVYRIVAFLFLAIISITISLYYAKAKKNNDTEEKENDVV